MDKITVCMIVKNEEACLKKCLESVKGIGPIVIVDTGSTDNTIEIARRYTDKVYTDYKWNDSFAEARNYAKSKVETDWILSIDADEYLVNPQSIVSAIENAEKNNFKTIDVLLESAGKGIIHYFPRLFKKECIWKGAVHNYINIVEKNKSDIKIVYGYSEAHKKDPGRSLRILTKEANKPGKVRELFYLAREYWYMRKYQEAINWYKKYLKVATWQIEIADACVMMTKCYMALKDYKSARNTCMNAININADFKEALYLMARLTGPNNSARWDQAAYRATNKNVLFVREIRNAREIQFEECIPNVYAYKFMLYIGANKYRCHMLNQFRNRNYLIDIVEPFKDNCKIYDGVIGINKVYNSTIQDFVRERTYDVVLWWHGPEHIDINELKPTLDKMETMANKYVILGTPWGNNPQEAIYGNPLEEHKTHLYEENFNKYNYKTNTIGVKDTWNSNLLIWKEIK